MPGERQPDPGRAWLPAHPGVRHLAACSGFLYALSVASQFVRTGAAKHALVVGAEVLTRTIDMTDRNSCILFGDGAGAVVLSGTPILNTGVRNIRLYSDGVAAGTDPGA